MKAITFQKGRLSLDDVQQPTLRTGWARLRLRSVGLCGTDVAKYSSRLLPDYHTHVLGHEFVGVIEEIAGDNTDLAVGNVVAAMPIIPCNNCVNCRSENQNLCSDGRAIGRTETGAFAEYVDVPVENLFRVVGDLPDVYILLDPLAVCVHANSFILRDSTPKKCLIIGDGTIACLQAWLQQKLGDEVWMIAKHEQHVEFMQQFGIKTYQNLESGRDKFDVIFEAVGRTQAQTLGIAAEKVAPKGQIIVLGVYEPGYLLPLEVRKIFIKEASVVGTNAYTPSEFIDAGVIMESNSDELKKFITHWILLSQFESALYLAQHKKGLVLKIGLLNDLSSETKKECAVKNIESLHAAFDRTTQEILSLEEWRSALTSGKRLRIKYGVDVTAPHLHIGHAVNLWMMRRLQDMGHCVIFLIGDFTTQIGDPTGKNKLRPVISKEEIEQNVQAFIDQAKMVLRFDDPDLLEIRRNSEWYDNMLLPEFLRLVSLVTHARLVSRDMFQRRIEEGSDIYMHELLYPVLQGYDSFMLDADLTIIGSDQLFNEMMGRFYQEKFGQRPQVIITTKITPGIDGGAKQSKSLGNYVGLGHSPRDKFGRLMSVPDHLISEYVDVYTDVEGVELQELKLLLESNPFEAKKRMATAVTERYHGRIIAQAEREWFEETFSARKVPEDIPEINLTESELGVIDLLRLCFGTSRTGNDLKRLVQQGGVTIDGEKITDPQSIVSPMKGQVLRVGKRNWFRIS